jgi:UDP-N-acetylglucosamine 2-epimerase
VQTIALQHGVITSHSFEYKFTPNERGGSGPNSKLSVVPSKFAVYGVSTKEVLQRMQYPHARIAVTGSPQYDTAVRFSKLLDRRQILKTLNVNPDRKVITLTTQPIQMKELFMRLVLNAVKNLKNVLLIVKPHPSEGGKWYTDFIERMPTRNAMVLPPDYNTMKALCVSDLVITMFSTTALEAMMLAKPVITINLEKGTTSPFAKGGSILNVSTSKELLEAINRVLTNDDFRRRLLSRQNIFLSEQLQGIDGQSSKRVINLINSR